MLENPLTIEPDGTIPCNLVEVVSSASINPVGQDCNSYCVSMGRQATDASMVADVTAAMQNGELCDQTGQPACSTMCMCRLPQASATNVSLPGSGQSDVSVCQNSNDGTENLLPPGFCYVIRKEVPVPIRTSSLSARPRNAESSGSPETIQSVAAIRSRCQARSSSCHAGRMLISSLGRSDSHLERFWGSKGSGP